MENYLNSNMTDLLNTDTLKGNSINNNNSNMDMSKLPMMALEDIPVPKPDAKEIVALVKQSGKVTGYQLSDGQVLAKEEGVNLARQGGISGVGIASRNGNEYLKSLPDGTENNNLSNLPSISGSNAGDNTTNSTSSNQIQ
jgi:hypothetical protein